MEMLNEFMTSVGYPLLATLLTAAATYIGAKLKAKYEELANDKTKKAVITTCVKAAEQLYCNLGGAEKLERAKSAAVEMLNEKGLQITDLELNMLIESVVAGLNFDFGTEG